MSQPLVYQMIPFNPASPPKNCTPLSPTLKTFLLTAPPNTTAPQGYGNQISNKLFLSVSFQTQHFLILAPSTPFPQSAVSPTPCSGASLPSLCLSTPFSLCGLSRPACSQIILFRDCFLTLIQNVALSQSLPLLEEGPDNSRRVKGSR